ncbi:MAG: hypothetical protein U9P90_02210 [Patescibacteria group bacterium]|nr:hypothetical protein [Patescibacteria group bacterium]
MYLNFGHGSDETDVGLGFVWSFLYIDLDKKELGWDFLCGDEKEFEPPKSNKPEDIIDFINTNYGAFREEESVIELVLDILQEEFCATPPNALDAGLDENNNSASEVQFPVKCSGFNQSRNKENCSPARK